MISRRGKKIVFMTMLCLLYSLWIINRKAIIARIKVIQIIATEEMNMEKLSNGNVNAKTNTTLAREDMVLFQTFLNRSNNETLTNINIYTTVPSSNYDYPLTLQGNYILNNDNICHGVPVVSALVMVHSATYHFSRRHNIRTTYGSRLLHATSVVRLVFLLGLPVNESEQNAIFNEHKLYGDIVQGDFIDTYHNLTHKGVMGLRWVTNNCNNSRYVVKVDDDVVFDIFGFLWEFSKDSKGNMWCDINYNSVILRTGKWSVPLNEFKGLTLYPWEYCNGFVVIMRTKLIPYLYRAAFRSHFFWIDDVYVYGILRTHSGKSSLHKLPLDFQLSRHFYKARSCMVKDFMGCRILASCATEGQFMWLWNLFKQRHLNKIKSRN